MRRGLLLTLLIAAVALPAGRVFAHAALSDSTPADGSVVTEPLGEVSLTFSEGVEPTAEGFAISVDGASVEVDAATRDGATWTLSFGPIATGAVSVAYDVVSADGHLITGELAFTVEAAAVATTGAPPPASAPPTAAASAPAAPAVATTAAPPVATAPVSVPTTTAAVTATTAATDADAGSSDTVSWVLVIAGGAALLGVLGWGVARRARS